MKIRFFKKGKDDFDYWKKKNSYEYQKTKKLLASVIENPYEGIGKPEPLRGNLASWWSRRITKEQRLVYRIKDGYIEVLSCRHHY